MLQSCNMDLRSPNSRVRFKSDNPFNLSIKDSIYTSKNNKVVYKYTRTKDTLKAVVKMQSITDTISVLPINSIDYLSDKISFFGLPSARLDNHPNRYVYPNNVRIKIEGDSIRYLNNRIKTLESDNFQRGDLTLNLSIPYINYFHYDFQGVDNKDYFGFLGAGLGVQYFLTDKYSLETGASSRLNFLAPIPASVSGDFDLILVSNLFLKFHMLKNKWEYSTGITYDNTRFSQNTDDQMEPPTELSNNLGIILGAKYQIGKKAFIGLEYNPTFINVKNGSNGNLNHLVSVAFEWKFRLRKNK